MLRKETSITEITVIEIGNIHVRETTRVFDDDKELSEKHHRYVLEKSSDISNQPKLVHAICELVWNTNIKEDCLYKKTI